MEIQGVDEPRKRDPGDRAIVALGLIGAILISAALFGGGYHIGYKVGFNKGVRATCALFINQVLGLKPMGLAG